MPIIHDLDKTMKQHIDGFYGNASVYRTNKFFVGFYGEYIKLAIEKMELSSKDRNKMIKGSYVYENAFSLWKQEFYTPAERQLDMRWACAGISIPHTSSTIGTENYIDSIKSIKYPIIKAAQDTGEVTISVRDDKNMMWYQFFNSLNNCFYRSQILKPRSSFQKVAIYIAPIQEQFVDDKYRTEFAGKNTASFKKTYDHASKKLVSIENIDGSERNQAIDFAVSQVFEFNSAVLKSIAAMRLSNDSKEILEYTVTFAVPNTFQRSFNNTFKGLADNTSDVAIGVDANMLDGNGNYNVTNFTVGNNSSALFSTGNGYYKDDKLY